MLVLLCWNSLVCEWSLSGRCTKKGSPSPLRGKPHRSDDEFAEVRYAAWLAPAAYASVTSWTRRPEADAGGSRCASLAHRARCWVTLSGHPTMDTAGRSARLPA